MKPSDVIDSVEHETVTYLDASDGQVRWGGNDDPRGLLEVGKAYAVAKREQHSWHTKLYLVDFPDKKFNSVCFK